MSVSTKVPSSSSITDPKERNAWVWGFTPQAEIWNGRFAMLGFVAALITEMASHQVVLHLWGFLIDSTNMMP